MSCQRICGIPALQSSLDTSAKRHLKDMVLFHCKPASPHTALEPGCSAQGDLHGLWAGLCPSHALRCNSCQTEPVETARSWPDRRPRTGGALQRAIAPENSWMECLGERGLLKETESALPEWEEHTALDTGQVPADNPEHNRRATMPFQPPTHFCSQLCAITDVARGI